MPVRNMLYDALQYDKQVKAVASAHRQKKGGEPRSCAEYLSGIYKDDRITPVITLVVHFGAEAWDGPRSLFEMMDVGDPTLADFIQDYRIHLIDPASMKDEELHQFSTNLREVLGYIRYSKDPKKPEAYIKNNPRMTMEADAARVISAVTKTPFKVDEDSEIIDVCKAIDEMIKERVEKGCILTLADLVYDGLISLSVAAERAEMTEAEFEEAAAKYS